MQVNKSEHTGGSSVMCGITDNIVEHISTTADERGTFVTH